MPRDHINFSLIEIPKEVSSLKVASRFFLPSIAGGPAPLPAGQGPTAPFPGTHRTRE